MPGRVRRRKDVRAGVVSVILVNYRGADDTIRAVEELRRLDWPPERLEVVIVDNSVDESESERLRAIPDATLIVSSDNLGFAGGCNLGVERSSGEFVAFLNNDARPDARWVVAAVGALSDESIAAVASRVLDWDGKFVDFIDAGLTWFGAGYKPFVGEPATGLGSAAKDVLFATGAAMFVRRSDFDAVGGFDERYFMFYEDVDLGWRLNLRGRRVRYVPESIAYHRHHASAGAFAPYRERYLLDRNALFTAYKNLGERALSDVLAPALGLTVRRGVAAGGLDSGSLDFRRIADERGSEEVPRDALASFYAVDRFLAALPELEQERAAIQASRTVPDAALRPLMGRLDAVSRDDADYAAGYEAATSLFSLPDAPRSPKVLVITGDPVGERMAGPAIRAWNIASHLASSAEVVLVSLTRAEPTDDGLRVVRIPPGDDRAMRKLENWCDVIVFQGHALSSFESLRASQKVIVADVYDPMHLEQLEQARELGWPEWQLQVESATAVLNEQLQRADFLICASERQRAFYLGQLAALGRLNPSTYAFDPELRHLLDVVPFGIDRQPPEHVRSVVKGVRPGIGIDDRLLIWGGGIYNWFDPETLVRGVAELAGRRPEVKLFFQGTKHPHPGVPEMEVVARTRALAQELGVLDHHVFFNDSWVEYRDRQNYLLEADAGVSTHYSHIETSFSFRTRILDYLWAGLPMVVTEGDGFAELVAEERLGVVVAERDPIGLAAALERVLFDAEFAAEARANVARVRERFYWDVVLGPLAAFVGQARPAPDRATAGTRRTTRRQSGFRRDAGLVMQTLRVGGPRTVLRKVIRRIHR